MNELFFLIIPNITATLIIRKLHLQPSIINLPRCKKNATIIYRRVKKNNHLRRSNDFPFDVRALPKTKI